MQKAIVFAGLLVMSLFALYPPAERQGRVALFSSTDADIDIEFLAYELGGVFGVVVVGCTAIWLAGRLRFTRGTRNILLAGFCGLAVVGLIPPWKTPTQHATPDLQYFSFPGQEGLYGSDLGSAVTESQLLAAFDQKIEQRGLAESRAKQARATFRERLAGLRAAAAVDQWASIPDATVSRVFVLNLPARGKLDVRLFAEIAAVVGLTTLVLVGRIMFFPAPRPTRVASEPGPDGDVGSGIVHADSKPGAVDGGRRV